MLLAKEPMRDSCQLQVASQKQHPIAINFLTLGRGPHEQMSRPVTVRTTSCNMGIKISKKN